jgi:hypothetical protein
VTVVDDLAAAAAGTPPPRGRSLSEIRSHVRGMLEGASAFQALDAGERSQIARDLVRVMAFVTDPAAGLPRDAAPTAQALDDGEANSALKTRLSKKQDLVGKDFKAGAANEGAKVFSNLVTAVDFPKFVSNLIEGVYTSIVNSSIKQMQAYGKLLEAVVKSVQEFATENVSLDAARDFVASSFPGAVQVDRSGGQAQLRLKEDLDDKDVPDFKTRLGMSDNPPLDEDNELKIVLAAQLKLAQQRQQQLATMVLMGINRIIVTEGEIKASVLFDVKAHDTAQRDTFANTSDVVPTSTTTTTSGGGWFSGDTTTVDTKVSTAYSEERDKSTADLEAKAKLSGSVTVKFKSETFPLERMASSLDMGAVQQKSAR